MGGKRNSWESGHSKFSSWLESRVEGRIGQRDGRAVCLTKDSWLS